MKTKLIPILTLAAATCPAITAFADLERKDSSQFSYKYEMLKSPTAEDIDGGGKVDFTGSNTWLSVGTGADLGSIKIDASTNGKYLISSQDVGTAGDGWRSLEASSSTGFTIESRVKITECTGANGAICLEAGPSDSKVYARLNFFAGSIGWNGTTLTNLDTSTYHTYRITRAGGTAVHSVWVDGVLVAENLGTGFTYNNSTLYRCLLGSPGSGWTGKAEVAYLRFHKGAFAPPTPNDKSRRKSSSDFPVQYEMQSADTRISTTGNTADWVKGGSGATIENSGGYLSVAMSSKVQAYWQTTDNVWKSVVTPQTPFTVDFKVKINNALVNDRAMIFMTGTSGPVGSLYVGAHSTSWQVDGSMSNNIVLDTNDNTDAFHVFRITYDGATRHGFTVWRDGVKIGECLVDCTNFYNFSNNALGIVRFGVASSGNNATHGGSFDIDYIRWDTTGAYDWKNPRRCMTVVIR